MNGDASQTVYSGEFHQIHIHPPVSRLIITYAPLQGEVDHVALLVVCKQSNNLPDSKGGLLKQSLFSQGIRPHLVNFCFK